jgi:hypothetical protein
MMALRYKNPPFGFIRAQQFATLSKLPPAQIQKVFCFFFSKKAALACFLQ